MEIITILSTITNFAFVIYLFNFSVKMVLAPRQCLTLPSNIRTVESSMIESKMEVLLDSILIWNDASVDSLIAGGEGSTILQSKRNKTWISRVTHSN